MSNTLCLPKPGQLWLYHSSAVYRVIAVSVPCPFEKDAVLPEGTEKHYPVDTARYEIFELFVLPTGEAYVRNHVTREWLSEQRVFYTAHKYEGIVWSCTLQEFLSGEDFELVEEKGVESCGL